MTRALVLFAGVALLPALCGPVEARAETIEVALCAGGSLSIPLRESPAKPADRPCCAKGCHGQRKRAPAAACD
jgi:hypothetical protein